MNDPKFLDCGSGVSLFDLISRYWLARDRDAHTFHRVCTIMRLMGVEAVAVENNVGVEEGKRLNEELDAVKCRLGNNFKKIAFKKLTFFRESILSNAALTQAKPECFLGYVIIVTIWVGNNRRKWSYIFEAITREIEDGTIEKGKWHRIPNQFLQLKRRFKCRIGFHDYDVIGSYFRQQNGITNVCAHACICMMLNNIPSKLDIFTAEKVNIILKFDHKALDRRFKLPDSLGKETDCADGEKIGLTTPEMVEVFAHEKFRAYEIDLNTKEDKLGFRAAIYGFIESQFPAFIEFVVSPPPDAIENDPRNKNKEPAHVFTVVGHTLSPHSWLPKHYHYAQGENSENNKRSPNQAKHPDFVSSLAWVDHLLIHDDNFGMQFTFPAHTFSSIDRETACVASSGLGIFPERMKIEMLSADAVVLATWFLRTSVIYSNGECLNDNKYTKRFLNKNEKNEICLRNNLVFRPVLVPLLKYIEKHYIPSPDDWVNKRFFKSLKEEGVNFAWLVEITESDLFVGNKSKVIDVLVNPLRSLDEDSNSSDREKYELCGKHIILARFPRKTTAPRGGTWYKLDNWKKEDGHIPIFCYPC